MRIYSFEKLEVWQNARKLNTVLYQITNNFPKEEIFGITSQLRRAGVSVTSNIAEGTSRFSEKEKVRFIEISYGSLMEVLSCTIGALDLSFLPEDQYIQIREKIYQIANQLNSLKNSFSNKD